MAVKIKTDQLERYKFNDSEQLWVYNGFDCMVTRVIRDALQSDLPEYAETYDFERMMVGPAMTMMVRGIGVDEAVLERKLKELRPKLLAIGGMEKIVDNSGKGKWVIVDENALFQVLAKEVCGHTVNYNSPVQLKKLLYEDLFIDPVYVNDKGKWKVSTNEDTLLKLKEWYPRARPFVNILLYLRSTEKLIEVMEKRRDDDKRMRCKYNVAGTETGRWSSSASDFNTGTNLQNITEELREAFTADEGKMLFNVDLEQAESRAVAYLAGDEAYIHACESGDLHTTVASMVFGIANDKEAAEEIYFRHFSYRDMAKRAGHGTNYGLTPDSLARHMKIPVKQAYRFNLSYLGGELPLGRAQRMDLLDLPHEREGKLVIFKGAFPGIRLWHEEIRTELQTVGVLETPFGRKRAFWGRLSALDTLREAIAYKPQSTVGDLLNLGLYRIWKDLDPHLVEILGQVHDSVMGQVDEKNLDVAIPRVIECMTNPIQVRGRTMTVPCEAMIGYNWGKRVEEKDGTIKNPNGLQKWSA